MKLKLSVLMTALLSVGLVACNDDNTNDQVKPVEEATPASIGLEYVSRYETGVFNEGASEIPAYDAATKRAFIVNAKKGAVEVLDVSNPENPKQIGEISTRTLFAGSEINSVAVKNGIVALAVQAANKTDNGWVVLYKANDITKPVTAPLAIGALPDNVVFSPDGKTVLVANEGEPNEDYSIDPEGTVSIIDIRDISKPVVKSADFRAFNGKEAELRANGVRIYGPKDNTKAYAANNLTTAAKDFEPEYITVSADNKTAWVTLQENNALAKIDLATAKVLDVLPLGYKNYGAAGNGIDANDDPKGIDIKTQPGVYGMYLPDSISSYKAADGKTYLVTANEGDSRAWGEGDDAYWNGDRSKGFVEEFRVKHLAHKDGFDRRAKDDLPPQLRDLAAGALLDPINFAWCGAEKGKVGNCRNDDVLGRLNISWTMGYETDATGAPVMYNASGDKDPTGNRLMYKNLYSYGARSFSIRDENGVLVWDSGDAFEKYLASDLAKFGKNRNINAKDFFNTGHDEGNAFDSRSDAKGPEPEGVAIGHIGKKVFAFIGLERTGGVMVYDITDPTKPIFQDYLNTREEFTKDPETEFAAGRGSALGDLGPEGLVFIPAKDAPDGKTPLLIVGNEVSGTTAVLKIKLK
ncbi:MAG TPA: choice-of-anchor I family protein [Acinetobacter sp.]|nr:choice-of-anchor I family protein [Acinetobacter sp.]